MIDSPSLARACRSPVRKREALRFVVTLKLNNSDPLQKFRLETEKASSYPVDMKLDGKIEEALNGQINQEMSAAYTYLAASAWFESENFSGFAHWMEMQRQEELDHAARLIQYLQDRGGKLELEAIKKPRTDFGSVMDVFQVALANEEANTESIHALYQLSVDKQDYSTQSFLKWFIDEQVEEESTMQDMIGLLKHAGNDPSALLVLNNQVGKRSPEGVEA